jgi:hypothetical protein
MIDGDDWTAIAGINDWQETPEYLEITYSSAALSTTNPTQLDADSNPGLRGRKPKSA